jgi:hypothetical protein
MLAVHTSFHELHAPYVLNTVTDSPEITGTASIFPISTASPSAGTSTSTSSKGKLVITGGVVGGIVAASLIGGVVAWFVIRRRRTCSHPSPVVKGDKSREIGESAEPRPPLYIPLKIYVSQYLCFECIIEEEYESD